ncbi:MAG: hypothetical protein ACI9OJ_001312 [Myxococcota bacterium]|jgi:hypothetical protein
MLQIREFFPMTKARLVQLQAWLRKRKYREGRVMGRFIAQDVRRQILIMSAAHVDQGLILGRVRTLNVMYVSKGFMTEPEFGPVEELRIDQIWDWTGHSWGGLADGTSIVDHNSNLDTPGRIWNRAALRATDVDSPGDQHLEAMLIVHGLTMNGGVVHSLDVLEPGELRAGIDGFRYFGLEKWSELGEDGSGMLRGSTKIVFKARPGRRGFYRASPAADNWPKSRRHRPDRVFAPHGGYTSPIEYEMMPTRPRNAA